MIQSQRVAFQISPLYFLGPHERPIQTAFLQAGERSAFCIIDVDVVSLSIPKLSCAPIRLLSRFDRTSVLYFLGVRGHCAIKN